MITPAHRRRLNRALHEVRRPLQALLLAEEAGAPAASPSGAARRGLMELLRGALAELDRELNGGDRAGPERRPISCRGSFTPRSSAGGRRRAVAAGSRSSGTRGRPWSWATRLRCRRRSTT